MPRRQRPPVDGNMSQAPSMPVFPDALIADTTHLSAEEFGAYCLILFATWRNNGRPFPDNAKRLAHVCRVTERRWLTKLRPVIVGFFDLSDGLWRQKRLEKEWEYVVKFGAKQRANSASSWLISSTGARYWTQDGRRKRLKNKDTKDPTAYPKAHPPIPIPIREEDSEEASASSAAAPAAAPAESDPVKAFWTKGVAHLRAAGVTEKQARSLIGKWRREFGDAAVLAAIEASETEVASEPIAFISACLANSRAANGANGYGRKTAATKRFERGRQASLDACLRIEKRNRERAARDGTSDYD